MVSNKKVASSSSNWFEILMPITFNSPSLYKNKLVMPATASEYNRNNFSSKRK
jgi:hypothetical protein